MTRFRRRRQRSEPWHATAVHRYQLRPEGDRTRVVYTEDLTRLDGAPSVMTGRLTSRLHGRGDVSEHAEHDGALGEHNRQHEPAPARREDGAHRPQRVTRRLRARLLELRPGLPEDAAAAGLTVEQLRQVIVATVKDAPPLVDTVWLHRKTGK